MINRRINEKLNNFSLAYWSQPALVLQFCFQGIHNLFYLLICLFSGSSFKYSLEFKVYWFWFVLLLSLLSDVLKPAILSFVTVTGRATRRWQHHAEGLLLCSSDRICGQIHRKQAARDPTDGLNHSRFRGLEWPSQSPKELELFL